MIIGTMMMMMMVIMAKRQLWPMEKKVNKKTQ